MIFALCVRRGEASEVPSFGESDVRVVPAGRGGLLAGLPAGIDPDDPGPGIPSSVPFFFSFSSSTGATRGVSLFPSAKSGLFPISSIEPPASFSASSRSSAACFITVFSLTGPASGALDVPETSPRRRATAGGTELRLRGRRSRCP